jgi:ferritin-like metal-binding protein YciE
MPAIQNLQELLIHELRDAASAEDQLIKALPKMAKSAASAELREAFENHLEETKAHYRKIVELLESFGTSQGRQKCAGIAGIVEEGEKLLNAPSEAGVLDAALICTAQKAEHYEIAAYGAMRDWAELLGHDDVAGELDRILDQESAADRTLTAVADQINAAAANPR